MSVEVAEPSARAQFQSLLAASETFGHCDHLRVAYELLHAHDFLDASISYARGIEALTIREGVPEKFNLTLTLAFISLIAERIDRPDRPNFDRFVDRNPDLMETDCLGRHYSSERLHSALAKRAFLLPDL